MNPDIIGKVLAALLGVAISVSPTYQTTVNRIDNYLEKKIPQIKVIDEKLKDIRDNVVDYIKK
jgi:hypothetical protein